MSELTQAQRDLVSLGLCPFCEERIRGYRAPAPGGFAPEAWAALREIGIDPASGHKAACARKEIRLT